MGSPPPPGGGRGGVQNIVTKNNLYEEKDRGKTFLISEGKIKSAIREKDLHKGG